MQRTRRERKQASPAFRILHRTGSTAIVNPDDFTFSHVLRVRWSEVDRQDVVFNPNYFVYFDIAVAEYWRAIGYAYPQALVDRHGCDIYAVKATADFKGSATYEDLIDVRCRVARIGRTSMVLAFGIWKDDTLLTTGELVYVNADLKTRKSTAWPDDIKEAILAYEKLAPTTG